MQERESIIFITKELFVKIIYLVTEINIGVDILRILINL